MPDEYRPMSDAELLSIDLDFHQDSRNAAEHWFRGIRDDLRHYRALATRQAVRIAELEDYYRIQHDQIEGFAWASAERDALATRQAAALDEARIGFRCIREDLATGRNIEAEAQAAECEAIIEAAMDLV